MLVVAEDDEGTTFKGGEGFQWLRAKNKKRQSNLKYIYKLPFCLYFISWYIVPDDGRQFATSTHAECCVSVPGDEMRSSQLITHKYSTSVICEREKAETIKKKHRELWSFFVLLQCTYQYQQYLCEVAFISVGQTGQRTGLVGFSKE